MSMRSLSQGANLSEHEEILATEQGGEQVEGMSYLLFNDDSPEFQQKVDVIDAIVQAPDKNARREAMADAAKALGKNTRAIKRMVERVLEDLVLGKFPSHVTVYKVINFHLDPVNTTKMQVDTTKMQVDTTKMQVDTTKMQVDTTKIQVDTTKMQVDTTKMQVDTTKMQEVAFRQQ